MQEFIVKPEQAGQRADVFVASRYPQFTRSSLERLFDEKLVIVNDKPAKPAQKIKSDDRVAVDESLIRAKPAGIKLPVIYEDNDIIVIDKPAGVLTHAKGALNLEPSVASFIKHKLTDEKLTGNRAGIVHRLDRGTSGAIVTAKTGATQKWLQKQFSTRKVRKEYIAIVRGLPEPKEAIIAAPIARNPRRPQTFMASSLGRPAITKYSVLKEIIYKDSRYALVQLQPQTGRTHQLRVHLAYIGHPIIGDNIYGKDDGELMLHAASLEITLPNKDRRVFKSASPPRIRDFGK